MPKICQVIFSTNRVEYLCRTLESQKMLNFEGCDVDKIFIDDMPKGRNDNLITALVRSFGYHEIYLHKENLGLSVTWTEFWNIVRQRNYDYVWHQEDDVEILEPVRIMDLVEMFSKYTTFSEVVLKRQKWYSTETETAARDTDIVDGNYRIENHSVIFSPMASLYPADRATFPYSNWYATNYPGEGLDKINFNEGMVGKALFQQYGLKSAHVKNAEGKNIVNHIGEYFVGKRVLPDEPHYDQFARYDPFKKYNSRDGSEFE